MDSGLAGVAGGQAGGGTGIIKDGSTATFAQDVL